MASNPTEFDIDLFDKGVTCLVTSGRDNSPREPQEKCDMCGDTLPSTIFCTTCSKFLCDACAEKHKKMRITKSHHQVAMSDWVMCTTQHNQVAQFYCKNDRLFCCLTCVSEDHSECDAVDLGDEDFLKEMKEKLDSKFQAFSKPIPSTDVFDNHVAKLSEDVYAKYGAAESHLEMVKLKFDNTIRELQKQLKQSLSNEKAKLDDFKTRHDKLCGIIEKLKSYVSGVRENGDFADVVDLADNSMPFMPPNALDMLAIETPVCADGGDVPAFVKSFLAFPASETNQTEQIQVQTPCPAQCGQKEAPSADNPTQQSPDGDMQLKEEEVKLTAAAPAAVLGATPKPGLRAGGTYDLPSPNQPPPEKQAKLGAARKTVNATKLWTSKTGTDVDDVMYDARGRQLQAGEGATPGVWWVRTWDDDTKLWNYNQAGVLEGKLGGGSLVNNNCRLSAAPCEKEWSLITTDKTEVVWLDSDGARVSSLEIPGAGSLHGVAFCPHSGIYAVTDCGKGCLWYVRKEGEGSEGSQQWKEWGTGQTATPEAMVSSSGGSESGYEIRRISGGGETRIKWPSFITHRHERENCAFVVSDNGDHAVKIFSPSGDLIYRLGCEGYTEDTLNYPCGVCVDSQGRVLVCDSGNKQVVRFSWSGDSMEVILSSADLENGEPYCLDLSPDNHLLVGLDGGDLMCFKVAEVKED